MTIGKLLAGMVFMLSSSIAIAAPADSLDQAKADGLVGEDSTGYIAAVVSNPASDVAALIADINEKRRQQYEKIAAKNGLALKDVEQLAARKAIEKTESGHYIRLPGSGWQKK
jgi:uncharacterized protein YdbL (DUF1318 family)